MPYKDPAVRKERMRDYMRDYMRRKRAAERGVKSPVRPQPVKSPVRPQPVKSPVSARPVKPQRGLTPLMKARATKIWKLTSSPTETPGSKAAARQRFAEIAEQAGITSAQLLAAIGGG
jgi:hypothetical protein